MNTPNVNKKKKIIIILKNHILITASPHPSMLNNITAALSALISYPMCIHWLAAGFWNGLNWFHRVFNKHAINLSELVLTPSASAIARFGLFEGIQQENNHTAVQYVQNKHLSFQYF